MKQLRILVGALDWGLGHATRCIPIIDFLLERKITVILGSNGRALRLLQDTYPELEYLELPSYDMTYTRGNEQTFHIIRQVPRVLGVIRKEHKVIRDYKTQYGLDAIISDNRYGIWHPEIPGVFITHQLAPVLPERMRFLRSLVYDIHKQYINKFDECWVPDLEGDENLSGSMSHRKKLPDNTYYIGLLSRFDRTNTSECYSYSELNGKVPEILVVLSGPEPQRTMLEEKISQQARAIPQWVWIVGGKAGSDQITIDEDHTCINIAFLGTNDLQKALIEASLVISRSGYSSLMDYEALGLSNIVLIPTPGQTEQEYLGKKLHNQGNYITVSQDRVNLEEMVSLPDAPPKLSPPLFDPKQIHSRLTKWLSELSREE